MFKSFSDPERSHVDQAQNINGKKTNAIVATFNELLDHERTMLTRLSHS